MRRSSGTSSQLTNVLTVSTGVTVQVGAMNVFHMDASDLTDIKFYINGTRVVTEDPIVFSDTGTDCILQPFMNAYKASGTSVGTLQVDYMKFWGSRA